MRRYVVLAVCLFLASPALGWAEFYRWVDRDGKEFFTNDRQKIPQEYRGTAAAVQPDERRVSREHKQGEALKPEAPVKEHKDRYGRGEEYWHKRAASLHRELKDLHTEYDLLVKHEQARDAAQEKKKKKAGKKKSTAGYDSKKLRLEKKIIIAKRKLETDLPEEARKADAYPGWLRE